MPDSGFIFSPAFRVVDASINAVAGGTLEFYEAGTSTAKTVYSDPTLSTSLGSIVYLDSAGHPVSAQGGSTKVVIYTGSALVKMIVKNSSAATVATYDNLKCTEDTSAFSGAGTGSGIEGVLAKATDYTIIEANDGYWIDADPTGGAFTVTFPGASDVGDGFAFGIRHAGTTTTNAVKFTTVSAQTISMDGTTTTAGALTGGGEAIWFVSNGANWRAISHTPPKLVSQNPIPVVDRLSTAPASPTAGSYYIVSGTPTGDWAAAGYAEHDLLRVNGIGGYTRFTPPADAGWIAYVADENVNYQVQGSAWVALSNITAPVTTPLGRLEASYIVADGTNGGAIGASTNTAYTRALNTLALAAGSLAGVTLVSNQLLNVPAGTYLVTADLAFGQVDRAHFWIRGTTAGILQRSMMVHHNTADSTHAAAHSTCIITLASEDTLYIENMVSNNSASTTAAGIPNTATGFSETYARICLIDLLASQGPVGAQGPQGTLNAGLTLATTLANGANSNVAITSSGTYYGKLRITGPTGAFSISGFAAPVSDNYRLCVFYPGSQTMTLTNEATSTAANRILTMTGADVALTGPCMIEFTYDTTSARWIYHNT
jgi:hypothetical protein